jgi:coenzyme F420-reducing hydrogenase beta subunit
MPVLASFDECTGCLACIDSCKHHALDSKYKSDGFFYPNIDNSKCIECKECEKICPIVNGFSYKRTDDYKPIPYAAWSLNDEFRMKSASGGVFPELAKVILDQGGIVIGAVIDGLYVKHIAITAITDLHLLQGSKYMQSNTAGIYNIVFKYLKESKTVLFSGTPCHIGALQSFLKNKAYKGKLYTIDIICTGVPSRLPIDIYNKSIGNTLKEIKCFRNKENSWLTSIDQGHCVICKEKNIVDHDSIEAGNFQMNTFINRLTLRMCCYNCKFAQFERKSDISLADYWKVRNYQEEHEKGISLVSVNSSNGSLLLNATQLNKHKITWAKSNLWYNIRFFSGRNIMKQHPSRQLMPLLMNSLPIEYLKKMYTLQNCESEEWKLYKKQHKEWINKNYQNNKQVYFNLMRKNEQFINIVSFQMAHNYGSVLQSYGLKQVVEQLGWDVRHINMKPNCWNGNEKLKDVFEEFTKMNFPHSIDLFDKENNILKFNDLDVFIVGSDQVWNMRYTGQYYKEFFLNFVPKENKKIAYAASFGENKIHAGIGMNILDEIKTYLQRFHKISCREKDGVNYCMEEFGIPAVQVLDPALLNIDYAPLFNPEKYSLDEEELVFFSLAKDRSLQYDWIEYIGKEQKLNVRIVNGNPTNTTFLYSHYVSPEEWLSRLYNSSLIVTNSFHAMIFAISFKKPFIIIPRNFEYVFDGMEYSRFESLLSDLDLEDRYFTSFEELKSDHRWKQPIDYDKVYAKLEPLREFSLNFLREALKD